MQLPSARLCPRVFAGSAASAAAAQRWCSPTRTLDPGTRSLLFTARDEDEARALQALLPAKRCRTCGRRVWMSGAPTELRQQLAAIAEGPELNRALAAFDTPSPPTQVMGILNVTPDSFSDGGIWSDVSAAVQHGLRMLEDGAAILDIGGESTRPGAATVPVEEELQRVLPVLRELRRQAPKSVLSVDTRKSAVARAALDAGADWINDVSGLTFDAELAGVVAAYPHASLVLMHSRLRPEEERLSTAFQERDAPVYSDIVDDTLRFLLERCHLALAAGVAAERLWIDPGFGFGKTYAQNVELLQRLAEYRACGLPLLIGTSRKSSVGRLVGDLPAEERLEGTAVTVAWAVQQGAAAVRVHDVKEMARVVKATQALMGIV